MKNTKRTILTALVASFLSGAPTSLIQAKTLDKNVSLGASLDQAQQSQTINLLGASQEDTSKAVYIDGPTVNHYLNDGSTAETGVFSSAIIEEREPGYGIQVQIVTPENIQVVQPATYQNAAITAGAKDVLIKVASAVPVTGEGALAGVYKLYEENGQALNQTAVQTAQKEIAVTTQVKELAKLSENQATKLQTAIKEKINKHFKNKKEISDEELAKIVDETVKEFEKKQSVKISQDAVTLLKEYAKEYAEVAKVDGAEVQKQIDAQNSEALTKEQAIDLYLGAVKDTDAKAEDFSEHVTKGNRIVLKNNKDNKFYIFDKDKEKGFVNVTIAEDYQEDGSFDHTKTTGFTISLSTNSIVAPSEDSQGVEHNKKVIANVINNNADQFPIVASPENFSADNLEIVNMFDNLRIYKNSADGKFYSIDYIDESAATIAIYDGPFDEDKYNKPGEVPENQIVSFSLYSPSKENPSISVVTSDQILKNLEAQYGENPLQYEEGAIEYLKQAVLAGGEGYEIVGKYNTTDEELEKREDARGLWIIVKRVSDGKEFGFYVDTVGVQIGQIRPVDPESIRKMMKENNIPVQGEDKSGDSSQAEAPASKEKTAQDSGDQAPAGDSGDDAVAPSNDEVVETTGGDQDPDQTEAGGDQDQNGETPAE